MSKFEYLTSESVTEGHPDKLADQISDAILDEILRKDRYARVAVETLVAHGLIVVAGEITTNSYVDIPKIARKVITGAGYTRSDYGIDGNTCGVMSSVHEQSADIALGVSDYRKEKPEKVGAGDQGMMFGYATDETPELMPAPLAFAHRLTRCLARARKSGAIQYLRPDGKSQVTIEYRDGKPYRVDTVLISVQHSADVSLSRVRKDVIEKIIKKVLPQRLIDKKTKFLVNPTGRFVIGGPAADTGLTGRKIIVDTYGGVGSHGGGAFSGKDPTKVDRSASYMCRWIAKNIVAAKLAKKAEVKVAYAIGVPEPLMIDIDTFGTSNVSKEKLRKALKLRKARLLKEMLLSALILKYLRMR